LPSGKLVDLPHALLARVLADLIGMSRERINKQRRNAVVVFAVPFSRLENKEVIARGNK
jgi:hypothetical protein